MPRYVTMTAKQGGYWLRFDYDPEVVSDLKQLPRYARKWNPEMKAWWIHSEWIEDAKRVVERGVTLGDYLRWGAEDDDFEETSGYETFDEFVNSRRTWTPPPPPPPKEDPPPPCFAKLYLLPSAPIEIITASYRALSKLHHPDLTSDPTEKSLRHRRMQALNDAYAEAKRIAEARR